MFPSSIVASVLFVQVVVALGGRSVGLHAVCVPAYGVVAGRAGDAVATVSAHDQRFAVRALAHVVLLHVLVQQLNCSCFVFLAVHANVLFDLALHALLLLAEFAVVLINAFTQNCGAISSHTKGYFVLVFADVRGDGQTLELLHLLVVEEAE